MKDVIKFSLNSFPNSAEDQFTKTSEPTFSYNCIGWSVLDDKNWWWPSDDSYWPDGIKKEETVDAFIEMYQSIGFEICDGTEPEEGFEKVFLFADDKGEPTHAARLLPSGNWTSKLGFIEDVEHSLNSMQNGSYGNPIICFKRKTK